MLGQTFRRGLVWVERISTQNKPLLYLLLRRLARPDAEPALLLLLLVIVIVLLQLPVIITLSLYYYLVLSPRYMTHTYVYIYICIHTYIYIYIHIYTHIHYIYISIVLLPNHCIIGRPRLTQSLQRAAAREVLRHPHVA